jgi:hypothetical protein
MKRKVRKKKIDRSSKKNKDLSKEKLPYIPPAQKIFDIDKDFNDIIYPPDIENTQQKETIIKKFSKYSKKIKYKFMKKFDLPEIYADIIFFIGEFLIAVGLIYLIMILLIIFTKPS